MTLKILVAGAKGKMGREVIKMVLQEKEFELVGGVEVNTNGKSIRDELNIDTNNEIYLYNDLEKALNLLNPDVLVDFTNPFIVKQNVEIAIKNHVYPVVGTTGLTLDDIDYLDKLAKEYEVGGIVAPNFALGAILMIRFAEIAAKYFPNVEIIEYHHDQKIDAPSGTAIKTVESMLKNRIKQDNNNKKENELIEKVRGGEIEGIHIHSVRLPGLIAHQEIIFGEIGQVLTIRHDALSREAYMPGVKLAIKTVKNLKGITYGLEKIIL